MQSETLTLFQRQQCILCLYFFINSVQIQFPALYINQALLPNSFFQNINISLNAYEMKCESVPAHLLNSLFLVIYLELLITQTVDNSIFFLFPYKV